MEIRECKHCGLEKPFEEFPKSGYKNFRRHACAKCYYKHNTLQNMLRVRAWFEGYKKMQECQECGIDDFRVLEFHHREDEEKAGNVSDMVGKGFSKQTLITEINKCDVVCANCHRIITYEGRLAQSG